MHPLGSPGFCPLPRGEPGQPISHANQGDEKSTSLKSSGGAAAPTPSGPSSRCEGGPAASPALPNPAVVDSFAPSPAVPPPWALPSQHGGSATRATPASRAHGSVSQWHGTAAAASTRHGTGLYLTMAAAAARHSTLDIMLSATGEPEREAAPGGAPFAGGLPSFAHPRRRRVPASASRNGGERLGTRPACSPVSCTAMARGRPLVLLAASTLGGTERRVRRPGGTWLPPCSPAPPAESRPPFPTPHSAGSLGRRRRARHLLLALCYLRSPTMLGVLSLRR